MSLGRLHLVGWKGAWNTRQRGVAAWSRSIVDGWTFLLLHVTVCHCYSRAPKKLAIFPWLGKHCPFLLLSFWDQNGDILRSFPNAFSAMKQYGWSTILFFLWRSVATSCCLPSRRWTSGCVSDWVVVGDVPTGTPGTKRTCMATHFVFRHEQEFLISFIMPCGSRIHTRPAITKADGPPQRRAIT